VHGQRQSSRLLWASARNACLARSRQNGTASPKSPPHVAYALITSGVMMELVGSVKSSSLTMHSVDGVREGRVQDLAS
jgi:hypothetical protein